MDITKNKIFVIVILSIIAMLAIFLGDENIRNAATALIIIASTIGIFFSSDDIVTVTAVMLTVCCIGCIVVGVILGTLDLSYARAIWGTVTFVCIMFFSMIIAGIIELILDATNQTQPKNNTKI